MIARRIERLESAQREAEAIGGRALAAAADVSNAHAVEAAAEIIERELGLIDVWVNNEMTTVYSLFSQIDPDEYRLATDVTYLGCGHRGTTVQEYASLIVSDVPIVVQHTRLDSCQSDIPP